MNFTAEFEQATYSKVTRRLMPFLFICYVLAYIDRVNVSFAKLEMQQDLGFSDAVYGLGAGIFFIGYFMFEVPANLVLQKIGARRWLGPIIALWGVVSACQMFVKDEISFYVIRFLLGVVECGFFPGVILYLTYWYTRKHRAKMVALFMTAVPLAGLIASPVSGWIMKSMTDVWQLRAWQWLFLLEGIPSVVAGLLTFHFLTDRPSTASWLNAKEKELLDTRLREEEELKKQEGEHRHRLVDAFKSGRVWAFCLIYFGMAMANYGLGFWLPQSIKDHVTGDPWIIGLILIVPWALAAVTMVLYGQHSDRTGERRWHLAVALIAGAAGLALSSVSEIPAVLMVAALSVAVMGIMSAFGTFWALPTGILSGSAAAAGIAWINSVGNLGGYAGPHAVGAIRDATGSTTLAMLTLAGACVVSAAVALVAGKPRRV